MVKFASKVRSLTLLLALFWGVLGCQLQAQQVDPEKDEQIRALFRLTGVAENMRSMMSTITTQFKESLPDVPEEFWDSMNEQAGLDTLIELSIAVYDKHFTLDEIKELIHFYQTDLGKTLLAKQPLISRDLMNMGMNWGQELGERIMLDLEEDNRRSRTDE